MIPDTSALLAVLFDEEDADEFAELIRDAQSCRLSAATFVELYIVLESVSGAVGIVQCDTFIRGNSIVIEPFTELHAYAARQPFSDYGRADTRQV